MEVNFQNVTIGRFSVDYTVVDQDKFVASASLSNFMGIDRKTIQNIVSRIEPYRQLCKTFEARDSKGRLQSQIFVPMAILSGLLEKVKSSKTVREQPEVSEKANYIMTCLTLLEQKTSSELFEMRADLIALLQAEAEEKDVFAIRADLSNKIRKTRKLKGSYFLKYQDRLNGQMRIQE